MIGRFAKSLNIALQAAVFGFKRSYFRGETIETILGFTDTLTDLPNKKAFERDVKGVDKRYSLVFIDIDDLKKINDANGHAFGDQVLKRLSGILHDEAIGVNGKVYRIAGDEFILIIPQSKVSLVCNTIRDNLRKEGSFTISQGVVSIINSDRIFEAINQADCAMYQAKAGGKDAICFTDQELAIAS